MMSKLKNHNSKNIDKDSSGGGGWEIVYSGFVLILLCFFIMLSSFASIEEGKIARFVKSFVSSVSILSGGLKFKSGPRILDDSTDIIKKDEELAKVIKNIRTFIASEGLNEDITLILTERGATMKLPDELLFESGVAAVTDSAEPILRKISQIILKTQYNIRIEGHTDNTPINTVQFPSNWELSTKRAVNILRYFIDKAGISPKRLSAGGFGEFNPIVVNDNPKHRAINRRVEIVVFEN